jgi:hypothetical protein
MPMNIIRDSGEYDRICREAASGVTAQKAAEQQQAARPGNTELWLELNEAAYIRGDIELADFERGLDAIYGTGALPDWIFKKVTMQVEHPPWIQIMGCGCPVCTGVEF